ncbi:MAG: hypothetical protein PHF37_08470 [Phycisphaerae bacterium]|jgi:hypothetical protein|nr:hypothetical protein [Phycisphaerae bacterium]
MDNMTHPKIREAELNGVPEKKEETVECFLCKEPFTSLEPTVIYACYVCPDCLEMSKEALIWQWIEDKVELKRTEKLLRKLNEENRAHRYS